jgi:hypothetical protein
MTDKYELEPLYRVYQNSDGAFVQVSQDPDGCGTIEVSFREGERLKPLTSVFIGPPEMAVLVAHAIIKLCACMELPGADDAL